MTAFVSLHTYSKGVFPSTASLPSTMVTVRGTVMGSAAASLGVNVCVC